MRAHDAPRWKVASGLVTRTARKPVAPKPAVGVTVAVGLGDAVLDVLAVPLPDVVPGGVRDADAVSLGRGVTLLLYVGDDDAVADTEEEELGVSDGVVGGEGVREEVADGATEVEEDSVGDGVTDGAVGAAATPRNWYPAGATRMGAPPLFQPRSSVL